MPFLTILVMGLLLDKGFVIFLFMIKPIKISFHMLILADLMRMLIINGRVSNQEKDFLVDINLRLNSIKCGSLHYNETNYRGINDLLKNILLLFKF